MSDINSSQKAALKQMINAPKVELEAFDKRTVNALVRRDFAKLISMKSGDFVKITAKGKKALN